MRRPAFCRRVAALLRAARTFGVRNGVRLRVAPHCLGVGIVFLVCLVPWKTFGEENGDKKEAASPAGEKKLAPEAQSIRLPGRMAVSLDGISDFPTQGDGLWWNMRGSKTEGPTAIGDRQGPTRRTPSDIIRECVFTIRGESAGQHEFTVPGAYEVREKVIDSKRPADQSITRISVVFAAEDKAAVVVKMSVKSWDTMTQFEAKHEGITHGSDEVTILMRQTAVSEKDVMVDAVYDANIPIEDLEIVGIDTHGAVLNKFSGKGQFGRRFNRYLGWLTANFKFAEDTEVAKYQLRRRTTHVVEFRDLPLQPVASDKARVSIDGSVVTDIP